MKKTVYCSLDIETSDFDPARGEVLELGMVFFSIAKGSFKILSQWQSVFRPSKPVPAKILALTGITESELENAPTFRDKSAEIQQLVKDAVIIGHNIDFDIGFLEGFGIKFSGEKIDTLYLAQMLLPTQGSYNLEALMHLLELPHADAHRALADAKAVILALEKFIAHFAAFPAELQQALLRMFSGKHWKPVQGLFAAQFVPKTIPLKQKPFHFDTNKNVVLGLSEKNAVLSFALGFDYYATIFGSISSLINKILLVLPNKQLVYRLWQHDLAYPVFLNRDLFNEQAFKKSLKGRLSREKKYFLAKILVWQKTNWQSKVLFDLNMSFLGNQFRDSVAYDNGEKQIWEIPETEKVIACDYADFVNLELAKKYSGRRAIILDINNFEQALTELASIRVSWHDFLYGLKQVYDSERKTGNQELKKLVDEMLQAADLFFGVALIEARKISADSFQILIDGADRGGAAFQKIQSAAVNFIARIEAANKKFKSLKLQKLADDLGKFFEFKENIVHWLELGENRFTFASSPVDLSEIAAAKLLPLKNLLFTASLGSNALIEYFTQRLALRGFTVKNIGQQQLRKKFEVILPQANVFDLDLTGLLKNIAPPAALLLNSSAAVRDFYEVNFKELQKKFKVLAMGFSGGANKLIENFSIQQNSLLIGTDNFILKQHGKNLKIKTLLLGRLPFEQFTHPLFAAQAEKYPNKFLDFNIPRALYNFHTLIKFFYSADLERIYILDQKIHKEYGKYFLDYLKSLPFVEIK